MTLLLFLSRESVSIFFNRTSYINVKPLDLKEQFTLSFRTCEGGTLLHQNGSQGYFNLKVLPGKVDNATHNFTESTLALSWSAQGSLNSTVLTVGNQLDQNRPYEVVFMPRTENQSANLSIHLAGVVQSINIPNSIYHVNGDNLTLGQGFFGCITFGGSFDLKNAIKIMGTSDDCPLDGGEECSPKCKFYVILAVSLILLFLFPS